MRWCRVTTAGRTAIVDLRALYSLHILLLPGIIFAVIGAHLALVVVPEATPSFPDRGARSATSSASASMPVFAVKSGAFFAMVTGILGLMGGLLQINLTWAPDPTKPSQVSCAIPARLLHDVDRGLARIWPPWEFYLFGHTIPAVIGGVAVIMGLVFTLLIAYPFPSKQTTGDDAHRQPVAAAARCTGAHRNRRDGDLVLHGAHAGRDERHHRVEVPALPSLNATTRPGSRVPAWWCCPRSSTTSPTGGLSGCSAATGRCSSTGRDRHHRTGWPHGAYIELHQPPGASVDE